MIYFYYILYICLYKNLTWYHRIHCIIPFVPKSDDELILFQINGTVTTPTKIIRSRLFSHLSCHGESENMGTTITIDEAERTCFWRRTLETRCEEREP